jgi:hypothetical protein
MAKMMHSWMPVDRRKKDRREDGRMILRKKHKGLQKGG